MALENLKSAFSNLIETSDIEGRHSNSPTQTIPIIPSSILEATTYAYDSLANEPLDLDGGMSNVNYPLMTELYNNPETTTTLNDPSSDIRFQAGIGFPSPNTKVQVSGDGFEASVSYVKSATGDMFVASGAVTKLGKVSNMLNKVGVDTPNFDFGAAMDSAFPPDPEPLYLTYPMMVEEMFNPNGGNLTDDFVDNATGDETRGIVFQTLGKQNKTGNTPDFKFQNSIQNEKSVDYISPVSSFTPGNIQFKDDYFKDIGQSLGSLGSALTPDIDLPNINLPDFNLPNIDLDLSGIGDLKFFSEDSKIRGMFDGLGGVFKNIGGFGKNIPMPKFPKLDIDFSKIGNFFKGAAGGTGGFLGGIGSSVSSFASGVGDKLEQLGDTIKDVGGPIAQAAKGLASNLNPLDEFQLPNIKLQNPRQVSVTEYGGQAIFLKNSPRALVRNIPIRTSAPSETADRAYVENDVSTPYSKLGQIRYAGIGEIGSLRAPKSYYPNASMDETAGGDKFTIADIKGPTLSAYDDGKPGFVDSEDNGMPFFFKDLRNNTFIIFRGYLDGITDNPSPNWSEQSYIGRSESNWVYTGTNREISFTFHLAAQTAVELDSIYLKLNKLTSLTYPEYMPDQFLQTGTQLNNGQRQPMFKTRMKPPLARMRLGDLFGNPNGKTRDGILGFLKSLSYTFPDNSPWETRKGQRVPKFIDVTCGWQVIHEQVPDINYPEFYGYNPNREEAKELQNQLGNSAVDTAALGG